MMSWKLCTFIIGKGRGRLNLCFYPPKGSVFFGIFGCIGRNSAANETLTAHTSELPLWYVSNYY